MLPIGTTGRYIKQARESRGMTQKELSNQVELQGVRLSPATLSKIEHRKRTVYVHELIAIAEVLEVRASWFLNESDRDLPPA